MSCIIAAALDITEVSYIISSINIIFLYIGEVSRHDLYVDDAESKRHKGIGSSFLSSDFSDVSSIEKGEIKLQMNIFKFYSNYLMLT